MLKKIFFILVLICFFIPLVSFSQESITIITYYPSPQGVYNQMMVNTLGVGDNDGDGGLDSDDAPDPAVNPGDVWIAGNVGIGIGAAAPAESLVINGNLLMSGGDIITDRWIGGGTNTFIGEGVAGAGALNSFSNTAVGGQALYNTMGGGRNTAIGYRAMYDDGDGGGNTAIGCYALEKTVAGFFNTAVGFQAGRNGLFGVHNVFIGYKAGVDEPGNGNVFIGFRAGENAHMGHNKLYIANSEVNPPLIYGDFGTGRVSIGTDGPDAAAMLEVTSTTRGFLPPRMTVAQRNAISSPPAGLMIYNTDTNKLNFFNGAAWRAVTDTPG